jgi:hypothetical protein
VVSNENISATVKTPLANDLNYLNKKQFVKLSTRDCQHCNIQQPVRTKVKFGFIFLINKLYLLIFGFNISIARHVINAAPHLTIIAHGSQIALVKKIEIYSSFSFHLFGSLLLLLLCFLLFQAKSHLALC